MRAIELDEQSLRSEFDAAQKIFFVMCLDMTQIVIGIFELSLDQKIRKIICAGRFVRMRKHQRPHECLLGASCSKE
jgi:hypothetical protein